MTDNQTTGSNQTRVETNKIYVTEGAGKTGYMMRMAEALSNEAIDSLPHTRGADIHDSAVIAAALAVLGTMSARRHSSKIGDACEALNLARAEIEERINA